MGFLLLVFGLIAASALSLLLRRHPAKLLSVVVFYVAFIREFGAFGSASVLGLSIGVPDVLALIMFLSAGLNLVDHLAHRPAAGTVPPLWRSANVALAVLLVLVAISLGRGITSIAPNLAFNEARGWLYIAITIAYFLSARGIAELRYRDVLRVSMLAVLLCGAAAALHVWQNGLGSIATNAVGEDGSLSDGRPLNSGQSMIIVIASLLLLRDWSSGRRASSGFWCILGLTLVILGQNRSTWIALACALLALFAISAHRVRVRIATAGALLGVAITAVALGLGLGILGERLQESTSNINSYESRLLGWQSLLDQSVSSGPLAVLIGAPFGTGWARMQGSQWVVFSPHNWYLSVYLRVGIVGFGCLAILILACAAGAIRRHDALRAAILVSICVYAWSYSIDWYLAPFLFMLLPLRREAGSAAQVTSQPRRPSSSAPASTAASPLASGQPDGIPFRPSTRSPYERTRFAVRASNPVPVRTRSKNLSSQYSDPLGGIS